jgi:hypothetical protein
MREFRLGPWVGEFGYWIKDVVPVIHGLREQYPDSKIVVASFDGDEAYLNGVHDEYVGYPYWEAKRGRALCERIPESVMDIHKFFGENFPIYNLPQPEFKRTIQDASLRIVNHIRPKEDLDIEPHSVLLCPRTSTEVQQLTRNWDKDKWNDLAYRLVHAGWKVYVMGINQDYFDIPVENLSLLPDGIRQRETVRVANVVAGAIADCCGGESLLKLMGCPHIVHAPMAHAHAYSPGHPANHNYLDVHVEFVPTAMQWLTPNQRYEDFLWFIDKFQDSKSPRYKHSRRVYNGS